MARIKSAWKLAIPALVVTQLYVLHLRQIVLVQQNAIGIISDGIIAVSAKNTYLKPQIQQILVWLTPIKLVAQAQAPLLIYMEDCLLMNSRAMALLLSVCI